VTPPPDGIYALEHEPFLEDQPIAVLVHGTLDRSASFSPVVRALGDLHVIVYDRRGYGRSARAQPLARSLADHADDLTAILSGRRATLVGHSYGGDVVLTVAAHHPELVASVAIFETPLPWLEWWPTEESGRGMTGAGSDPGDMAEAFFRRQVGDEGWDELPPQTQAARRAEGPTLVADFATLRDITPPFDLSTLEMPLLIGCGTESTTTQRNCARRLAEETGAELVTIEGAEHGAHVSHPEAFAGFVRQAVALGQKGNGR
jgi:pimeloyl-ACP methyl ester carboxylesterase